MDQEALHRPIAILLALMTAPVIGGAEPVTLQVKSFIQSVDLNDSSQFDPDAKSCQMAMSALVKCGTIGGEQPTSGDKDEGKYRLWSSVKADVACAGNKVAKWEIHPVDNDAANEFVFITTSADVSPPLSASPSLSGTSAVDSVSFTYRMRGQPNVLGNATMSAVKARTCTYIWHKVDATLICKDGKPRVSTSLQGSGFPSHRIWVDGVKVKEMQQGPFKNLWICNPTNPALVK